MGERRNKNTESVTKALKVLEEILQSDRYQSLAAQQTAGRAHASQRVYADEPILKTGRQMKGYLPARIRQMKAMSRYEPGTGGAPGRWLSEEEYFWRQGTFMADFEDDCPYQGTFMAYYPTYSMMSDQQLRGYFTWRAQVRRGRIEETSTSFAYVYLYELICGIGVREPAEGFRAVERFWRAYREFAPELDRYARVWLQDYVVYHGLDPKLLAGSRVLEFDRALIALERGASARPLQAAGRGRTRRNGPASALPLPADEALEQELFDALDALSTYRLGKSRLYKAEPAALRHVACAVYVRTSAYYDKNRKAGVLESWFGRRMEQSYVMFASAVFFEPERHADCVYELNEVHRYRYTDGRWTCERYHGSRQRSAKLGQILRATDRCLRQALGFAHPLKDDGKTPKYLQKIIDTEVAAWLEWEAWQEANAPRRIEVDLSQLAGIRAAAADTREALLVDEEREGAGPEVPVAAEPKLIESGTVPDSIADAQADALSPVQARYLRCLVEGAPAAGRAAAVAASGLSEDMLVDAVNEALFDAVGDTVVEFGPDGPVLVEDYIEDIREVLEGGAD